MLQVSLSNGYALSEKRINRIVSGVLAGDYEHAMYMGLFDRLVDHFWRGGAKEKAVREAFYFLGLGHEAGLKELSEKDNPYFGERTVAHMVALEMGLKRRSFDKLSFSIDVDSSVWSYALRIDNNVVAQGSAPASAFRTRNWFLNFYICTNLRRVLLETMPDDAANRVCEDLFTSFRTMDASAEPEKAQSPAYLAQKMNHVKQRLNSAGTGPTLLYAVWPDGTHEIAQIRVGNKDLCKLSSFGVRDCESFEEWIAAVQLLNATMERP
jgi:hypothetical protein